MVDPGADSDEIKEEILDTFESKMEDSEVPPDVSARIETELRSDDHPDVLTEKLLTEEIYDGED